MQRDRERGFQ